MTGVLRLSCGVLAIVLNAACSSSSQPRVSPAPQSPPAAAAPSATLAGVSAPNSSAGAPAQADVDRAMRKRGYKPALYRGERVYCRDEVLTGSNLASKVCLTAEQIADLERSGQDLLKVPHPAGCSAKMGGGAICE